MAALDLEYLSKEAEKILADVAEYTERQEQNIQHHEQSREHGMDVY